MTERRRQAEVRFILSKNFATDAGWQAFVENGVADPTDDSGWFSVDVGFEGEGGADTFQVCIATQSAMKRLNRHDKQHCLLVDRFDAATIEEALKDRIESISGFRWTEVVDELQKFMRWEFG